MKKKEIQKKKRRLITVALLLAGLMVIGAASVLGVNAHVKSLGGRGIVTPEEAESLDGIDCIVVLGCLVEKDGTPSNMLEDRLRRGIELYEAGVAPKLLMSGDHGRTAYDEVNVMKQVAVDAGIPSEDVFMDHAGFSTYETIYRAKEIFGAERILIVTQEYHLYRALYIAERLGVEAYGVAANYRTYQNQVNRDLREVLARCKDFVTVIYRPKPTCLGDPIPLTGDGNATNDS